MAQKQYYLIIPVPEQPESEAIDMNKKKAVEMAEGVYGGMMWRDDSQFGELVCYPSEGSRPCIITSKNPYLYPHLEENKNDMR